MNYKIVLDKIYDFLNKENADILCMQEYLNQNIQSKTSYEFKNYNSKTLIKASTNIWSSRVYIDTKNAIVKKS